MISACLRRFFVELDTAFLFDACLLYSIHFTLQPFHFGRRRAVSLDEEQARPEQNKPHTHGDRITARLVFLNAADLRRTRGKPRCLLSQLRT